MFIKYWLRLDHQGGFRIRVLQISIEMLSFTQLFEYLIIFVLQVNQWWTSSCQKFIVQINFITCISDQSLKVKVNQHMNKIKISFCSYLKHFLLYPLNNRVEQINIRPYFSKGLQGSDWSFKAHDLMTSMAYSITSLLTNIDQRKCKLLQESQWWN